MNHQEPRILQDDGVHKHRHRRRQMKLSGLILCLLWSLPGWVHAASLNDAYQAFQQGQFARAQATLQALRQTGTAPASIAWLSGHVAYAQKQYALAKRAYQKALQTCHANQKPWLHNDIGNTYYHQKQWQRAIHHYAKALSQKPDYERARFNLELALRQLQQQKRPPPPPPRNRPPPPPPPPKNRKKRRKKPPKQRDRGLKPHRSPPRMPKSRGFRLKPFDRFLPYSRVLRHRKAQKRKP